MVSRPTGRGPGRPRLYPSKKSGPRGRPRLCFWKHEDRFTLAFALAIAHPKAPAVPRPSAVFANTLAALFFSPLRFDSQGEPIKLAELNIPAPPRAASLSLPAPLHWERWLRREDKAREQGL